MKTYLVILKGHNFLLPYDGEPRKMGFSYRHQVRADTPEAAEQAALAAIARHPLLVQERLNGAGDPTRVTVDSVRPLGLFKRRSKAAGELEFFFEDQDQAPR